MEVYMNSIKAITQLEELKRDRLSFIQNDESDEIYLKDIKAISLAIKALKKCPDIQDKSFNCRLCGKELRTWKSIQKGFKEVFEDVSSDAPKTAHYAVALPVKPESKNPETYPHSSDNCLK